MAVCVNVGLSGCHDAMTYRRWKIWQEVDKWQYSCLFSLMDSVQSMLCCTNKIITCFIINKHTNTDTDVGEKEKVTASRREKALYWDYTGPPLKPAVQEMWGGVPSQFTDSQRLWRRQVQTKELWGVLGGDSVNKTGVSWAWLHVIVILDDNLQIKLPWEVNSVSEQEWEWEENSYEAILFQSWTQRTERTTVKFS